MATVIKPRAKKLSPPQSLPPLENGDHLDQPTFHERYLAMPEGTKAELIGGVVYMAAAQKVRHSRSEPLIIRWLDEYAAETPHTEVLANATDILSTESEPQPDACLIVDPAAGGQTHIDDDDYLVGPPELAVEISSATESIDLNSKLRDYESAGVLEYLVVALRRNEVFWFERKRGKFQPLPPSKDGMIRSKVFPGLWLAPQALLNRDRKQLLATLHAGLASPEHAKFVAKLAKKKR